jgi:regulator of sirC expression with transglutaminase-like and TPR domain
MDLDVTLARLATDPSAPLDPGEVGLALARDEYPDLDTEAYVNELAGMAREARTYLHGDLEARVRGLCRYLFHDQGFRGNQKDYYDARNSYLNDVLDRRTGIPITLSVVAVSVGNRAGLTLAGVGLPGHFVAKAADGGREVIFDPFHGGRLLTPEDCERIVGQTAGTPFEADARALRAMPPGLIVQRMLMNLKGIYLAGDDFAKAVRVMKRLCQLSPKDLLQRRDLGATLLRSGKPGEAIDHLNAYLTAGSAGADEAAVKNLLQQARGEVARWN